MEENAMRTRIFLFSALMVTVVAACAKINEEELGVPSPVNGEQKTLTFLTEKGELSRTALGTAGAVSWSDGDKISVFGEGTNNLFNLTSIESDGSAKFSGSASGSPLYALYPYNADAAISSEGVITTVLPADQVGVKDSFAPDLNLSVGSSTGDEFLMRNVCGLVAFNITRTDITSVTLSSNGKEFLTGNLEITLDGSGIPSCDVTNGTRYVTLHPEGSTFEAGTYYAVVLPRTYVGGWRMTFTTASQAGTVKTSADASVQRSHILDVHSPDAALALSNIITLGEAETANCYVAGSAGRRYKMPVTVMGNNYTLAADANAPAKNGVAPGLAPLPLAPKSAQLLWQTAQSLLYDVTYEDGYVYFTLNGSVGGTLTPGNASIAVYDGEHCTGDLLWSWHIWVTDADLDGNLQTWAANPSYTQYSNYASSDLMDRNLGALSDEPWSLTNDHSSSGLLYQWGRKDPFVGADDSAWNSTAWMVTYDAAGAEIPRDMSSAKYSSDVAWGLVAVLQNPEYDSSTNPRAYPSPALTAKYPMRFVKVGNGMWARPNMNDLWGLPPYDVSTNVIGHKTIYDPCPPGYRVMQPYAMSNVIPANAAGGKFADVGYGNILNSNTYATDYGYKIKYNDSDYSWFPCNGSIKNDTAVLFRVGSYGYLWTCKGSPTNHNGVNCYYDSASFYSVNNGTRSGFGHGVRCQKID